MATITRNAAGGHFVKRLSFGEREKKGIQVHASALIIKYNKGGN